MAELYIGGRLRSAGSFLSVICFKISTAPMFERLTLDVDPGSSYLFGLIWANPQILLP